MFTTENARELQLKGARSKVQQKLNMLLAAEKLEKDLSSLDFQTKTLTRIRMQMQSVQTKLEEHLAAKTLDSKAFKELTEAFARLETAEQKLSGRASPGSLRPSSKGRKSDRQSYAAPEAEE